jgi:hypothetical protein
MFVVFFCGKIAEAQADQGTITGTVQDATGAVIPGAQVTLTSTDTGLVLRTKTDRSGIYTFPPAKIGNYSLSVSAPGFQTTNRENLHLNIQQRMNVPVSLNLGNVSETVTVTTAPPVLQSDEASTGQVMSTETINNLPLNGRNWVYAVQLAAGVSETSAANSHGSGNGDFDANGQAPEQNNFILDGIDNNASDPAFSEKASYVVQPPPDALAEFKVQTSDYSAEFGHSAGAVVNASIKAGSNSIHGDLWEYLRNDVFDARDFDALTIPKYRQNQFGATLGAPILRNRLFFFGYAEANRIVSGQTGTYSVPTPLMRQGNFTELLNTGLTGNAQPINLYQAGSAGTQVLACNGVANVMCSGQIDQVALNILKLYPLPNTNNGDTYNNYNTTVDSASDTWQWGTRVDWNISSKDQAFSRFSYFHNQNTNKPALGSILDGGSVGPITAEIQGGLGENFAFSETHLFTPTLVNEVRFGYNYGHFGGQQANSTSNVATALGLGGIPAGSSNGGLPKVAVSGLTAFGSATSLPNLVHNDVFQILDNVTKIVGNHSLKFGVELHSIRFAVLGPPASRGTYNFNGYFTGAAGKSFTGYGVADFLLDQMNSATLSNENQFDDARWYRSLYALDDWKVNRRLTLNLGLRYDYYQPVKEVSGDQGSLYVNGPIAPGSGAAVLQYPNQASSIPLSSKFTSLMSSSNITIQYSNNPSLTNAQFSNLAPRLGFAYMMSEKTVIRGGFGISYGGLENVGGSDNGGNNYPFQYTSSFPRPSTCKAGNCLTNGITLETGFAQQIAQGLGNSISTPSFSGVPPNIAIPYSESYNLTVERALSKDLAASIGYVGNVDRHLVSIYDQDSPDALIDPRSNSKTAQPFPNLAKMDLVGNKGTSNYNALQAKLQRHLSRGLNFLAAYTWSHTLDDSPALLTTNAGDPGYRNVNLIGIANDYSQSSWDVRQSFNFNGMYELPWGKGRAFLNHGGWTNVIAGGWAADLMFRAQTGQPLTGIGTDLGSAAPNGATAYAVRISDPFKAGGTADPSNPGVVCAQSTRSLQHWYNPCAFANPPLAFPNAQVTGSPVSTTQITGLAALPYLGGRRLSVEGPGVERINMSAFKSFPSIREQRIEFRADVFNLLNTPAYGAPAVSDDSSSGGQITSAQNFQNYTPDARFFQLSAKYLF